MMTVKPKRIGMITPSSNTVVEPVTMAMTAALYPRVTTQYTRIEVKSISPEQDSLSQFDLDPMRRAAAMLADVGMDAIAWNGTSGAWRGFEDDQRLCDPVRLLHQLETLQEALWRHTLFRTRGSSPSSELMAFAI